MNFFLCSFRPLVSTAAGRAAAKTYGLPPFIDGSCRREPDLQHRFPSISALCRTTKFAPRIFKQDHIAYITVKDPNIPRKLVACLEVMERFENHLDAAKWYKNNGGLPSNCMVQGNRPAPIEHTSSPNEDLSSWEEFYLDRSKTCGVFLACKVEKISLFDPPSVDLEFIFGRTPATRTPPQIKQEEYEKLLQVFT